MQTNMKLITSTLFIFLCFTINVFACVLNDTFSITEKSLLSANLIEGTVIEQESVWLDNQNRIVTIHTVLIEKNFKNSKGGIFQFITNGGIVNEEWHHSSAELDVSLGERGVFFLSENKLIQTSTKTISAAYAHFGKNSFINVKENSQKIEIYNKLPKQLYNKPTNNSSSKTANQRASMQMQIDCFYPNIIAGGNLDTLIIQGSGFDKYDENESTILFRNPDSGGYDYIQTSKNSIIEWSDEEIMLHVPQNSGSGDFKIINRFGQEINSNEDINIKYNLKCSNSDQLPTKLIGKNNSNGYTFTFGENMINTPAHLAFMRALNTLRTQIGFNVSIDSQTTNNFLPSNDGVDVIAFDSENFPLNSVAIAYSQFRRCGGSWEVAGVDVFFKSAENGVNWHFDETPPSSGQLDFETVALHELLHTFQLNHNTNMESIMYYTYTQGTNKRTLSSCYDLSAANDINERSLNYEPSCMGHSPYFSYQDFEGIDISNFDCETAAPSSLKPSLRTKVYLQGFYMNNGKMNANYAINGLLPTAQPFNIEPLFYNGTEIFDYNQVLLGDIVDWILIEFYEAENQEVIVLRKAGILRSDGRIIQANGQTSFILNELDSTKKYYFNIIQSNHLEIRNATAINLSETIFYDFTNSASQTLNGVVEQSSDNKFMMYSGDFDGNGIINNIDYNAWAQNNAQIQAYLPIDADGNSIINNLDFNEWSNNRSKISPAVYGD